MKKTLLLALALTSVTLAGCAGDEAADETVIIDEAAAPITAPADDMMMEGDSADMMMEDGAMAPEGDAMAPAAPADAMAPAAADSTAGL